MGNSESTEYAAAGDNNEEGSAYRKHDQEHQGGQYPTKYAETVHHTSLKSVDYSKEDIAFAGGDTSRRQSGVSSRRIIKTSEFSESTTDPIEIVIAPDSGGAIYSNSSSTDGSRRSSRQYMQQQQLQYPRAHSNYSHVQQQQHRQQYSKSLLNQQDNVTDMDLVVSALEKQRLSSQSGGEISLKTTTSTTTAINHPPPPLAMGQSYIMAPISSGNQHSSNMPSSEELTPSSATSKNGSNFFKSVGKRHSFGGTFHSVASSVVPIFSGTGVGPTNHQKRRSLQNSLVPYFTTSKKQDVESSSTAPPDSNHNQQQKKLSTSFKFPFISKRQPSAPESLVLGSFQQQLAGPSQSLLQSNTYKDMSSNTSIQQSQEQPNNSFYQFSNSHQQSDTSGISVKYQHTTPHPLSKDSSLFDSNLVLADPLFSSGNTNGGPAELKFEQHQQQNHASSLTSSARPHLPRERQESDTILNPLSSSYRSASTPPPPPVPKISSVAVAMLPPYPFVKADSKPKSLLMDKLLRSLDVSPMKLSSGPQSPSPISPIQNSSLAAQSDASLDDSDEEVATQPPRINKNILRGDTNRSNSSLYREDARRNDSRRNSVDLNDLKKVALRKTAWNANSSNSSFQLASNSSIGDVNIGSPFGAASANSSSTNPSATGAAGFNSSKKDINQKMSNPSLFNTKQLINQHLMRAMSSDTTQLLDKTMKRANSAKMVMVSSDQLVPLRKAKGSKESLQSVLMLLELRPKKTTVMKKSNSCSTLFVDYTLIKNDLEETLHW